MSKLKAEAIKALAQHGKEHAVRASDLIDSVGGGPMISVGKIHEVLDKIQRLAEEAIGTPEVPYLHTLE